MDLSSLNHLRLECPDLNGKFFNIKKKTQFKKKILIVSGGSRNGNHLVTSLLDSHEQLPTLPGEDRFLSQIFWEILFRSSDVYKRVVYL